MGLFPFLFGNIYGGSLVTPPHRTPSCEEELGKLPADVPRPPHLGAVLGAQPKLLLTKFESRFYLPDCTPPDLQERWDTYGDLAQQLMVKSGKSKVGKRADMTEVEILDQYLLSLITMTWTSETEAKWVIRRVGELLNWPIPASASEQT